jgi:LysM repeat protein
VPMRGPEATSAATPPVAPATSAICPYLLSADGSWRASTVAREHRCTAVSPPAILAADKQRRLCLVAEHIDCATYVAAQTARDAAAGSMVGRGPQRPMPRTSPVVLDHGRFGAMLPGMPDRGVGQGGLVALMAVAFGALAVGRLTGGGPDVTPAGGTVGGSARPSVVGTSPAATARPTSPDTSPASGPSRTLVPSDVDPTPSAPGATPTSPAAGATYKVKSGDTLSGIAAAHGTTWQVIAQLNNITDPAKLRVGQVLQLP